MTEMQDRELDRKRLICRLRELIRSLDSRVPHLEREGEAQIAREAMALRDKALARLAVLERLESVQ
jgi:hypothetical protein